MIVENSTRGGRTLAGVGAALAGLTLLAGTAQAQPYSPYDQGGIAAAPGVTVQAPRRYARQPTTGAWVRLDSVSRVVPLGDLDLATRYGAHAARYRIERAARRVCAETRRLYPFDVSTNRGCYQSAVQNGLAQAQDVAGYPILAWGY
ncbi:MAG TPA: UrcA family protein [Caulobacteraceae bacterium]|nr:UrcA family protein [Caulobacteraceae bacterium]